MIVELRLARFIYRESFIRYITNIKQNLYVSFAFCSFFSVTGSYERWKRFVLSCKTLFPSFFSRSTSFSNMTASIPRRLQSSELEMGDNRVEINVEIATTDFRWFAVRRETNRRLRGREGVSLRYDLHATSVSADREVVVGPDTDLPASLRPLAINAISRLKVRCPCDPRLVKPDKMMTMRERATIERCQNFRRKLDVCIATSAILVYMI